MEFQLSKIRRLSMEHRLSLSDLSDDVIAKILQHLGASSAIDVFKCKTVCKAFARAGEKDEVYLRMEVDSIFSLRFNYIKFELLALLRENVNPNMLFRDGVVKVFYIGDEAAGKGMLQQAAKLGQRDATLVLGMLLMAEGGERIAEARRLLNDEYTKAASRRDVVQSVNKVRTLLSDHERLTHREFPVCLTCTHHHASKDRLSDAWWNRREWLFCCNVCLWDACYLMFAAIWDLNYN